VVHPLPRPATRSAVRTIAARLPLAAALFAALAVVLAGAASAHVVITPNEAAAGGYATLALQVPNERDDAQTTKLEVQFPTDHPIASVRVEPVPGWTADVQTSKLATPIKDDDGEITEAVSTITWTGGSIGVNEFQRFPISVGPLPTGVDQLQFKALQTYSDGEVVRWIDAPSTDGSEPEHPAPTLTLTAGGSGGHGAATTTTATSSSSGDQVAAGSSDLVSQDDVDSAKTLGIVGIVVGAVGLLAAAAALVRKPKGTSSSRPS
jgi:uncharacterized protein